MTDQVLTRRGAATREKLLEAAAAELVERDGALEVATVAARAGVSVGLLYRYFGSKAGLVAAVVDDFNERLLAQMARARELRGVDWATRERRRTELSVAFHYDEPLAPVLLSSLSREPEVVEVEQRWMVRLIDDAARGVARGQRDGDIPDEVDPRFAAAILIGGTRAAMWEALTRARRPSRERLTEDLWLFVVHGARARLPAVK